MSFDHDSNQLVSVRISNGTALPEMTISAVIHSPVTSVKVLQSSELSSISPFKTSIPDFAIVLILPCSETGLPSTLHMSKDVMGRKGLLVPLL